MTSEHQKMQPWQVFQAARKYLGAGDVARIFGREKRSAYSWAQDPAYTLHRCQSPLELLHVLFSRMDAVGLGYVVRAALAYLATALEGGEEEMPEEIREPLATIGEEVLADYSAVAALQRAIDEGAPVDEVATLAEEAQAEVERTVARYVRDNR